MKFTKTYIKTYKESPKEAETISHKLMLRAGMIKQVSRGNYTYMPLGLRVLQKIEKITREEMNKAGAIELLMPIMQPADLWKESGRWNAYGPELMRFKDRNSRDFVLGPTHEEIITYIFREHVKSYKELPLNFYQIQTKFRDEIRPRFGLMRGREFIMKDAYSFHLTKESLDKEYLNMKKAYCNIFSRCELNFRPVEADTGSIGGAESHEFMVLANSGEDDILYSDTTDYAANVEKAISIIDLDVETEEKLEKELIETPNKTTIDSLAEFLNISKKKIVKSVLYKYENENLKEYYMAIIRSDLEVNDIKVKNAFHLDMELELVGDEDIEKLGICKGYMGALRDFNDKVKIVMDESVKYLYNFVVGANKENYHYKNVNLEDLRYDVVADIRKACAGDRSPIGYGILKMARGIEVGHIFKLGDKYSKAMGAKVLDENGKLQTVIMGCYGIGISRVAAAAIEQNNDEHGMIWPRSIAPYEVDVIATNMKNEEIVAISEKIYENLLSNGVDVIYDDRLEKAGFKFKDADLIGFPIKVIVGNKIDEGLVEIKYRKTGESKLVKIEEVIDYCK